MGYKQKTFADFNVGDDSTSVISIDLYADNLGCRIGTRINEPWSDEINRLKQVLAEEGPQYNPRGYC